MWAEGSCCAGSYVNRSIVGNASGTMQRIGYQANVARTECSGFRYYSRQQVTNAFARAILQGSAGTVALQFLRMSTPLAENPGALTAAPMSAEARPADP